VVDHGAGDTKVDYGRHFGVGKMLGTTSINERGQIVIPDKARKELGINADDMFVVFGNKRRGALILIKSEVFERFAEAFMNKLGKLEKYAQAFFHQADDVTGDDAHDAISDDSAGDADNAEKSGGKPPGGKAASDHDAR
jgi:AbrB family looped-hinge helix DNA binding protein